MPLEFSCPACRQLVQTPDAAAGKKGKCPHCGSIVQIPGVVVPGPAVGGGYKPLPAAPPPDTIEFFCFACGQLVRTPAAAAGKKGKCPHCQSVVQIPETGVRGQESGDRGQGTEGRGQESGDRGRAVAGLKPLPPDLTPLPPLPSDPLAGLTPLSPDALADLPPLPADPLARPPAVNPFEAPVGGYVPLPPKPKLVIRDHDRRGLPWERDPSLETLTETVTLVITAPGDAFSRMRRRGGLANPLGFLLVALVVSNVGAMLVWTVLLLGLRAVALAGLEGSPELTINWGRLLLGLGASVIVAVIVSLFAATIGGLIWATIFHVSLLVCGAANAGFEATYRVVAFSLGSVSMLALIPVLGPLAGIVIQPLSLIFGFMEAHETSGGRAVLAVVLPFLATAFCCVTPILILLLPAIQKAVEAAH